MDANKIASNTEPLLERIQRMLTERLKNFSNEARILLNQEKSPEFDDRHKLGIVLESIRDISEKMIIDLIANSSLSETDRCVLTIIYSNPHIMPKK